MSFNTLDYVELAKKRVLVRVDINTPVKDGEVSDDTRIRAIVPTIEEIIAKGGKAILLGHFGRPRGKVVPDLSLEITRDSLTELLGVPVHFIGDCIGPVVDEAIERCPQEHVILLENTRFHPEEEANDPDFAAQIARLGDVFVNDAFSAAHRAHATTEGVARLLPSVAGRLMQNELEALEKALGSPERPVVAVVGGAKVSTKLDLLSNLISTVDQLVIGGGMANTFLAAQGLEVGKSLCERDLAETAGRIMAKAVEAGCEILLPSDVTIAREFVANAPSEIVAADACPPDAMILDTGPAATDAISKCFDAAQTVIWNGPLGAFELEPFNRATDAAAEHAARLTEEKGLVTIAGGGDTVAALNRSGSAEKFTYVSTAGGAFLEWLEGRTLPGVAALEN